MGNLAKVALGCTCGIRTIEIHTDMENLAKVALGRTCCGIGTIEINTDMGNLAKVALVLALVIRQQTRKSSIPLGELFQPTR